MGIGSVTDSLSAIKELVFDQARTALPRVHPGPGRRFRGPEALRQRLLNKTPKYGNDDDYADDLMTRTFRMLFAAIDGRPNTKGGAYRVEMLPTTCHVYFGEVCRPSPTAAGRACPCPKASARCRAPTATAPPPCSGPPPRWTTSRPAAPC